ncbi:DNA cytosine methyltransferase [Staphylococcus sp. HMSC061G04]|uniref:DNA cytosine methyltransferase n=1 Tax=Staphylococcus sp. HMSC061G04 TaxID=1715208 RepID=UPI0008A86A54|nr:DNA cytosine methyltransferase [Staphylococcus sp. HMSC061G04]OHP63772.1 DNA cytosine methyltransferase [Staphylococcus sp. HMSC061G04]
MNKLKVCSLFAGVGGIDLAFEQTGNFETIIANEIDAKASETYRLNFNNELIQKDIRDIEPENLPNFDVLLSGFPCTSFSIAGYRKGFEDETSGDLFFETLKVIVEKQPQIVFLENVKNLVGHDKGNTFKVIREALETNGYNIKYQVLNAKDYGNIPQNRERIYIVGFKDIEQYKNFDFPKPINLKQGITDVIDFSKRVDDSFYYTEDKYKFYNLLKESIVKSDTIYQWRRKYVRENKSNVSPTLTANMGTGGHNVPLILSKYGIRKFTPRECFALQGFPESFKLPDLANSHLYKQAGNSVVVPVVNRIAQNIYKSVNNEVCI